MILSGSQNIQDKKKQALLFAYDQNQEIKELRVKYLTKSVKQSLKHRKLHSKLDILEKDFLTQNTMKRNSEKENNEYSQAFTLLQLKLSRNTSLPKEFRHKIEDLMASYTQIHQQNQSKTQEIQRLKLNLQHESKLTQKLNTDLQSERKNLIKLECQGFFKEETYKRCEKIYKILDNEN